MKFGKETLLLLWAAVLLTGCGGGTFQKPETQNESIIIGYIDMDDAPGSFNGVSMKKLQPAEKKPYYNFATQDGIFYRGHVPFGVYKMDSFTSFSSFKNTSYSFNFPQSGRSELDLKITKPGVYFVGSWKFKKVDVSAKEWLFGRGKFDLVRIGKPTELELLKKIQSEAKEPYWADLIKRRIAELGK